MTTKRRFTVKDRLPDEGGDRFVNNEISLSLKALIGMAPGAEFTPEGDLAAGLAPLPDSEALRDEEGLGLVEAILKGSAVRLLPVLMTASGCI